jgi:Glycosyl transferase family 2
VTDPVWTILIPTTGNREKKFRRLIGSLAPQLGQAEGTVTVQALWNNGERPLAAYRQDLITCATSQYVSFIDDDDEIPEDFVKTILPLLDGQVHFIGFTVDLDFDGVPQKQTLISPEYGDWWEDDHFYYRDITYVNPIRRDIALQHADFTKAGWPEDSGWVKQLRGHLYNFHIIDKVMYFYHWSPADSVQTSSLHAQPGQYTRPVIGCPHFTWHPASLQHS